MLFVIAASTILLGSCSKKDEVAVTPAIHIEDMDQTVRPQDDFFQHVNGGWIKNNPLKPEYARFGMFDVLAETSRNQVNDLLTHLGEEEHEAGSDAEKILLLFRQGTDSLTRDEQGADPIRAELEEIKAIQNSRDLSMMVGKMHAESMSPYFAFYVSADEKNSSMNIAQLYQSGLGMRDRDYYLEENSDTEKIRDAYKKYINRLFELSGFSDEAIEEAVQAILKVETGMAKVSYDRERLRDSKANYRKMDVKDFRKQFHFLDWDAYFEGLGVLDLQEWDVKHYDYYKGLDKLFKNLTLNEQKYYLLFNVMRNAAPYLSDSFAQANFDFYGHILSGREKMEPLWKRSISTVNGALGEAVGKLYVEKYFPQENKDKMLKLVNNLQIALGERIQDLSWMSNETKSKALEKLSAFTVKIGYPEKWKDYSKLVLKDDSYWANIRRANMFDYQMMLADLGKPVDRTRWLMNPHTVNAYYNPTTNEICFPAGILQPPFFNADADDAVNYGAIGVVIGHEMTHGFDDQGRNYDKNGNLANWWTEEDANKFKELTDILAKQFDDIIVTDTVHANGRYTLGENLADHGGLLIAYQAFMNSKEKEGGQSDNLIDGFTPEQRFYLAYARLWAQNIRDAEILRRTKSDVHSLGKWRVNATLRNIASFYRAFNIQPEDKMYLPENERVVIW